MASMNALICTTAALTTRARVAQHDAHRGLRASSGQPHPAGEPRAAWQLGSRTAARAHDRAKPSTAQSLGEQVPAGSRVATMIATFHTTGAL